MNSKLKNAVVPTILKLTVKPRFVRVPTFYFYGKIRFYKIKRTHVN
ncbi:hypothetical protein LEP1GSC166_0998 [Leptospira kirschneri]|nr:hypothetical protein LEP1GSC166_0998 [Leptospira kirschneri]